MKTKLTEEKLKLFIELYPDNFTEDLMEMFSLSKAGVYNLGCRHKIKKSKLYQQKLYQRKMEMIPNFKNTVFQKGHVNVNTGKKIHEFMSAEQIEVFKKNWFKKGQKPHNTRADFEECVHADGYTYIKIPDEDRMVLKQRYIYEQHHGKIADDHLIIFIDKDKTNFAIENLKMVDKKENMTLNNPWQGNGTLSDALVLNTMVRKDKVLREKLKSYPELLELKRTAIKINIEIKQQTKNDENEK